TRRAGWPIQASHEPAIRVKEGDRVTLAEPIQIGAAEETQRISRHESPCLWIIITGAKPIKTGWVDPQPPPGQRWSEAKIAKLILLQRQCRIACHRAISPNSRRIPSCDRSPEIH